MVGGGGTSPWPPDPSESSSLNKGPDSKRRRCAEDLPGASGRANGEGHRLMVAEEAEGEGELVVDEEMAVEEEEAVIPPGVEAASPGNGKAARRKADMQGGAESDRKKENRLTVIIDQLLSNRAKGQEACTPGGITNSGEGQSETESAGATELQQTPSAAAAAAASTAKPRRRRGGSAATGRADAASGLAPSGSVKAERLSPSSGGSSRGSVSPGGGAATPSSSSAASTYAGTPPGERGSPGGGAGGGAAGPPTLPSPHPPLQHTPALKQMEQMMTRNYSDFMRSLAAKYNNSNPNDYFSAPRNGFLSGLDSRFTPFKAGTGGAFPGLAPIPTTATRSSATPPTPPPPHHVTPSASVASAKEATERGVPQYSLYSASTTFPATSAASLAAFHHPLIDMSSTQALISMVRSASAQSASQLETYLKGAAGALKRPAPTAADPTASTSSAVAAAAAAASSSSPLDLSSSSATSSSASSSSSTSSTSASCSLAAASALAAAAAASACKKARTMDGNKGLLLGGGLAGSLLLPHTIVKAEAEDMGILPRKDPKKGTSSVSPRPRANRTLPTPPPVAAAASAHLPPPPPPPPLHQMQHSRTASVSNTSPCMSLCTDASKPCSGSSESSDPREAVARWSVDDVCAFVSSIDICAEYAPVFRDQRIDGSALPLLTEEHLTSALSMKLGPALKLRAALARRLGHCAVCLHCVHCHGPPAAPKPPTPATTPSPAPTPPAATPAPAAPSPAASPAPVPAAMSPASAGAPNAASSNRSPSASGEGQ